MFLTGHFVEKAHYTLGLGDTVNVHRTNGQLLAENDWFCYSVTASHW